jgi:hypothetical protein
VGEKEEAAQPRTRIVPTIQTSSARESGEREGK